MPGRWLTLVTIAVVMLGAAGTAFVGSSGEASAAMLAAAERNKEVQNVKITNVKYQDGTCIIEFTGGSGVTNDPNVVDEAIQKWGSVVNVIAGDEHGAEGARTFVIRTIR